MKRTIASRDHVPGFTLIEVLIVVAVVGIAGAVIVPQMLTSGTLGVQAAARHVIADMLFAQNDAIAKQKTRKIIFDAAADSYKLVDENGGVLNVDWKGAAGTGNYVVSFADDRRFEGVTIKNVDFGSGSQELVFDDLGAPTTGGTVDIEFKQFRYRITVAEFTGRVTVQKL